MVMICPVDILPSHWVFLCKYCLLEVNFVPFDTDSFGKAFKLSASDLFFSGGVLASCGLGTQVMLLSLSLLETPSFLILYSTFSSTKGCVCC